MLTWQHDQKGVEEVVLVFSHGSMNRGVKRSGSGVFSRQYEQKCKEECGVFTWQCEQKVKQEWFWCVYMVI